MQTRTSIFLDLVRFSAACIVLFNHLTMKDLNGVLPFVRWGHDAVVIFFVMSGFVISYATSCRKRDATEYAVARLGRLYSVVVPALLLTYVFDLAGRAVDPDLYKTVPEDFPLARMLINLLFLQQNWNLMVSPFSNTPFWSLGFEFWYYLIFGAAIFLKGFIKYVAVFLLCLCAGPRILVFMPLWLFGVFAFRLYTHWNPSPAVRRCLLGAATAGMMYLLFVENPLEFVYNEARDSFPDRYMQVGPVSIFIGDMFRLPQDLLLGLAFALMLINVRGEIPEGRLWKQGARAIRYFAGATFTIYAFHKPMIYFFIACLKVDRMSASGLLLTSALVFVSCLFLSYIGERQGTWYRDAIAALFLKLGSVKAKLRPAL